MRQSLTSLLMCVLASEVINQRVTRVFVFVRVRWSGGLTFAAISEVVLVGGHRVDGGHSLKALRNFQR